jgi:hypothetical protein
MGSSAEARILQKLGWVGCERFFQVNGLAWAYGHVEIQRSPVIYAELLERWTQNAILLVKKRDTLT